MTPFVPFSDFERLLEKWAQAKPVYVLRYIQDNFHYQRFTPGTQDSIIYDQIRAVEPLKSFFFKIRQKVAEYPSHPPLEPEKVEPNLIIIGAKACDLWSAEVLDDIFTKGEIKDPFYMESRNKAIIISSDCSSPAESCFCTMLGFTPYPQGGFDLNLSKVSQGLVVEVGSEKGEKLVAQDKKLFVEASPSQLDERDKNRAATLSKVKEQNKKFSLSKSYQEIMKEKLGSPVWNRYSGRCVECAACLSVCPTCHCFLLYDQRANESFARVRLWDFCYYRGYARVGGGANPRPTVRERFKNKYIDKFDFSMANFGVYACTGCGRCIEACLANIDMRQVFKDLEVG